MDQPEIAEKFAAVVNDITDYCMKSKADKWKGGFSGMLVVTVPTELDGAVGNFAGFVAEEFQDRQEEVIGAGLVSLLTGLLLMGWDETILIAAVKAASAVAQDAVLFDTSDTPEN